MTTVRESWSRLMPKGLVHALDEAAALHADRSTDRNPLRDATHDEITQILDALWYAWPGKASEGAGELDPSGLIKHVCDAMNARVVQGIDAEVEQEQRDRTWADAFVETREQVVAYDRAAANYGDDRKTTAIVCRCGWIAFGKYVSETLFLGFTRNTVDGELGKHREGGCDDLAARVDGLRSQIPTELRDALAAREAELTGDERECTNGGDDA